MIPLLGRLLHIPDPLFSFAAKKLGVALFAPQRTLKGIRDGIMSTWHMHPFAVPTLVVLGYRDRVFRRKQYEDVLRCNPGAQLVDIPVSAHLVQLERPDAVNRAISRFIEKQQPDAKTIKGDGKNQQSIFQRIARKVSFEVRPAGNAVSLEDEMLKVASNQMDFQTATQLYARGLGLIKSALGKR